MFATLRVLVALAAVSICHAVPAAVTRNDIDRFLQTDPHTYDPKDRSDEVLDILIAYLPDRGFDAAVEKLAKKWQLPRAVAAQVAEAELRASLDEEYEPLYLAALDRAAGSGRVWDVLLARLSKDAACDYPGIAERYFAQQGMPEHFLRSTDWNCAAWVEKLPMPYADAPLAHWRWMQLLEYDDPFGQAAAGARLVELLETADAQAWQEELISALRHHWSQLASAGLISSVLRETGAVDKSLLDRALDRSYTPRATIEGIDIRYNKTQWLRNQMTLALLVADRRAEAESWFGNPPALAPRKDGHDREAFDESVFGDPDRDTVELIRRVLVPPAVDPFDLFIGRGDHGLLWSVGTDTPVSARATASFFAAQGYADLGGDLRENLCEARRRQLARKQELKLPQRLQALRAHYLAAYEKEWFASGLCAPPHGVQANVVPARADYIEKPLPPHLRTIRTHEADDEAELPSCIENVTTVRCDTNGEHWAAIAISNELDPTGEVGQGGYWLYLSPDRGRSWDHPLYLGLQQFQPYVVPRASRLPILHGSQLQLEVQVREIDIASITFPPVGLRTLREADDLYIERSLEDLARDSDRDGLTDLLEDKLRTDPHRADTDGDGLDDGSDTLPGVSLKAETRENSAVIARVVEHLLGYDDGAIRIGIAGADKAGVRDALFASLPSSARSPRVTFLLADKALFAGLLLPSPVVVLDATDLAYLDARYGLHYPIHFPSPWFNKARTKAVVQWSAGWVGGTLFFTKEPNGAWKSEVVKSWIT
jgi:hypothetical protein